MLIYGLNKACKNISNSYLKVGGESRSKICFWTMTKGNLPHLSYIFFNMEPLGTEFNIVACSVTGALILIGLHTGNEGMKHIKYHQQLGATAAFNKRFSESTKGIGQRYRKGAMEDCFIFGGWLYSKKSAEAAMEICVKFIGMIKKM